MPELIDTVRLERQGRIDASTMEFTAIDVETTALQPGRVIEIGAVRINGEGTVLGEFSTLVNPGPHVDPGATWVHHITREDLNEAPAAWGDIVGYLLELCEGSVLVAHNLPFESRFLTTEFERVRPRVPRLPGLCTLSTARSVLRLPNYRLATLVEVLDLPAVATHAALDDARACARLVACLVSDHSLRLHSMPPFPALPKFPSAARCAPRVAGIRAGERGWMASLMDRLPDSMPHVPDAALESAYRDQLTEALADMKIVRAEAEALAKQARAAGMSAADVRRVHTDTIGSLRRLAEQDGIITANEHRDLTRAATALGVPEIVSDLAVTRKNTPAPLETDARPRRTRVLVLGSSAAADQMRARVLTEGISLAKNLTPSVTHVIVDHTVTNEDSRRRKANNFDVSILTIDEAVTAFGWTISETAVEDERVAAATDANETKPCIAQPPTQTNRPEPLPVPDAESLQPGPSSPEPSSRLQSEVTASVPESIKDGPNLASTPPGTNTISTSRPAGNFATLLMLWTARLVLGFGAFLVLIVLLAALGGAPAISLIVFGIFALLVITGGELLRRKARRRITSLVTGHEPSGADGE